jgi:hypothetical protein
MKGNRRIDVAEVFIGFYNSVSNNFDGLYKCDNIFSKKIYWEVG